MTSYGFGKKSSDGTDTTPEIRTSNGQRLDFSGIRRAPVTLDPAREEAAIQRGDALGFARVRTH